MQWDRICREIEAEPKLTPEDERALWRAWKGGDERSRKKLVACTLRYALGHAKHAARPGQRWEPGDLLGEAARALAGCADRWDGSGSFSGYASARVRGTIKDFLRRKADVMRAPAGSERALSLDQPSDAADVSILDRVRDHDEQPAGLLPELSAREKRVLELTVLRMPTPGLPEDAAKALGWELLTVHRLLRAALRKSGATC